MAENQDNFLLHDKIDLFLLCKSAILMTINKHLLTGIFSDWILIFYFLCVGLPVVVNLAGQGNGLTDDKVNLVEGCRRLEQAGADVVGLNCTVGPTAILPLIKQVKEACKVWTL